MPDFKALKNTWLLVDPGVILTERIDAVVVRLDEWFAKYQRRRHVNSGFRLKQDQVRLIIYWAKQKGVPLWENARNEDGDLRAGNQYVWQPCWSALLAAGVVINPPREAPVLQDYKNSNGVLVRAGTIIQPSKHMYGGGGAFDISGREGEQSPNEATSVTDEVEVVNAAMIGDRQLGISNLVPERENNTLHCNLVIA